MNVQKILFGILLCATFSAQGREFRAPACAHQKGYDFDVADMEGYRFQLDTTVHTRNAHRAFTSEMGTSTHALTGLIFNKDEFRLSQIFPQAEVSLKAKDYNPFMRIMKIAPRADYSEHGMNIRCTFSKEFIRDKGTLGVRVNVPFKSVQWRRTDAGGRRDSQLEDVVSKQMHKGVSDQAKGFAYRLDFLEAIPQKTKVSQVAYTNPGIYVFSGSAPTTTASGAAALYSPEGIVPKGTHVGVNKLSGSELPASLEGMKENASYDIGTATNYASLTSTANLANNVELQDKKAAVWITSMHTSTGTYVGSGATKKISGSIGNFIDMFTANSYEWLHDHGYEFGGDVAKRVGMGDIDVDVFYNHILSDRLTTELSLGAKLPTGSGKDYSGNPYHAYVGNGEHVEVRLGARLACEARHWLAVILDGSYAVALSSTEKMCAVPEQTLIKNMGQAVEADVSWNHAHGDVELHFCHPRTTDITGMLGYQLFYKTKDSVSFKKSSIDSWMGALYDGTSFSLPNTMKLDNDLAAANTEQMGHRIKGCLTYQFSDWFSMTMGGLYTFAGKNCPRDADLFASCSVVF